MKQDMRAAPLRDEASYDSHGVDLSLIRWMLSLSPTERLAVLEDYLNTLPRRVSKESTDTTF